MAVGGVDHEHVDAGGDQQLDALFVACADADRRADPQLALRILGCDRMLVRLLDVLDGDQAAQLELVVDDQHALEAVLVHQALGFVGSASSFTNTSFSRGVILARASASSSSSKRRSRLVMMPTTVLAFDHREAADAVLLRSAR